MIAHPNHTTQPPRHGRQAEIARASSNWHLDGIDCIRDEHFGFEVYFVRGQEHRTALLDARDLLSFKRFRRAVLDRAGVLWLGGKASWMNTLANHLPTVRGN